MVPVVELLKWAETYDEIRAALVIGSRARIENPADEWSDLDIVIVAKSEEILVSLDWIKNVGSYWVTFIENTPIDIGKERRVLFDGGYDVDFIIVTDNVFSQIIRNDKIYTILRRGLKIILDKDGLCQNLPRNFEAVDIGYLKPLKKIF